MNALAKNGWFAAAAVSAVLGLLAPEGWSLVGWLGAALLVCGGVIAHDPRKGTAATAVLATLANGYLLSRKFDASGSSMCNINQVFNCDLVNHSAASEMFGLPITLYGLGFYLGLVLAASMNERSTPRLFQVSGLFSIVNLGYSAYLAYESKVIGAVCVVCFSIYAANALLLWAALAGLRSHGKKLLDDIGAVPRAWTTLIIATTFAVTTVVGAGAWHDVNRDPLAVVAGGSGEEQVDPLDPRFLAKLYAKTRGPLALDGSEPLLGDPNAPFQLVEFADFGCPHCAHASREVEALVEQAPQFNVRFKVFPLSGACNPGLERDTGPERCRAAQAAECGNRQGQFWQLSRLIFANQSRMEDEDLRFMAGQIGLDMDAFDACMADDAVMEGVRADAASGLNVGVMGTPTMFMMGLFPEPVEMYAGVQGAYALAEAVRQGVTLLPPGPPRDP